MRRFPAGDQLDEVAGRGELTPAPRGPAGGGRSRTSTPRPTCRPDKGGDAAMREVVEGNARRPAQPRAARSSPSREVAALNDATAAELDRVTTLLEERRAAGMVRHCHGDLHLRNIVLLDGQPVLFDCIEFNDDLRLHRRALRPGLPGHGPPRPRAPVRGVPAAPGLWRPVAGRSWAGTAAAVPRGPCDRPGQGRGLLRKPRAGPDLSRPCARSPGTGESHA